VILPEFKPFNSIRRFAREYSITEKIDGTNGQIYIDDTGTQIAVASRNKWLDETKAGDHHGFYKWVMAHKEELLLLGPGHHYGEWAGQGIAHGYGLKEKRFYLFNTNRWTEETKPKCCHVVPVLHAGDDFSNAGIQVSCCLNRLQTEGSVAVPGWMKPEGVVIYHVAGNFLLKKTLNNDGHKSLQKYLKE
jgi:hypothetical protein